MKPNVIVAKYKNQLTQNPLQYNKKEISDLEIFLNSTISAIVDFKKLLQGKTVFIKPNLNCIKTKLNPYAMTDPRLLLALINCVRKNNPKKIIIGEKGGQGRNSKYSYDLLTDNFVIPPDVELINLEQEQRIEMKPQTALTSVSLALPQSYVNADVIIDVAKMKTHTLAGVSLGIKNLFGLLTDEEKIKHHNEDIHLKLVDLLSVRNPEITIIDGLFAMEGQGPLYGTPRKENLLIAADNCVAADAIAVFLMGYGASDIECIRLANKYGLGEIEPSRMNLTCGNLAALRKNFIRGDLSLPSTETIEIIKGKNIPAGYLNAISHSLERITYEGLSIRPVKIYAGVFEKIIPTPGSIIFGDVTIKSTGVSSGFVIKGHPPRAFVLYDCLKESFLKP